ncbi:MAG: type I-MYXAN CRISPR-associated protein Cas6/Cmx6 [Gammaproteobacteria bacterium]|nr:type I-MYXAN CRISPR-associated protein Cas6/Cmx6 [Gammaproteobacteria bacterium]MBU1647251.1 type I-MYXAN CRISPR-associated protein Cas6/Cmx6 [Gammaproteobacteria bacterium]MBU1972763.1 type I-MYXAN CRISPR-associated protein Cas6/Cmx6 [Gammaproteobacteria bacterium]
MANSQTTDVPAVDAVDLVFALRGRAILADYAGRLRSELLRCLPWLADEVRVGVHPLGGVSDGEGEQYLSGRSRLTLRLPRGRVDQAQALCGQRLDLGGDVEVGRASARELSPATVLYSSFVAYGPADETAFMAECQREFAGLRFRNADLICGMAQRASGGGVEVSGFSLMVHGLSAVESLQLQMTGLGSQRQLGCGIFVPHKSIAGVGEG